MSDYGIAIAKPGQDVMSATGENLVFSSKYNTFNIFSEQQVNVAVDGDVTVSTAHDLGYKPAFMAFSQVDTTDTVAGVSYSNAIFHCESEFLQPFYRNANKTNSSTFVNSKVDDVDIHCWGAAGQTYKNYLYIFSDLAEETSEPVDATGNNYGLRIAQSGYDAITDPDYRMIYSSKYKVFHIGKTGTLTLNASEVTLNDTEVNLVKSEVTFSSMGISSGYHPFICMIQDISLADGNPVIASGHYIPMSGWYFVNAVDEPIATNSLFLTNDRLVAYIWRSHQRSFLDPETLTYPAVSITYRYMIFDETFSIT